MKLFSIQVDQKLFCRFYSGEHIGFGSGHTCNGPRYRRSLFWRLATRWRMRLCVFSLPTDGLLLLGLSFKSFLCCKHRRSYSGWNRNFFPLSKKRIGGHKLEGDPTVLKLTDSFFLGTARYLLQALLNNRKNINRITKGWVIFCKGKRSWTTWYKLIARGLTVWGAFGNCSSIQICILMKEISIMESHVSSLTQVAFCCSYWWLMEQFWFWVGIHLGLIWVRVYSSQSTCVEVDWSGIKLNSIQFHSNTCGLR